MRLSHRLSLALIAVALFAVAVMGIVTYYRFEALVLPRALETFGMRATMAASEVASAVGNPRADVAGFRFAVALDGIVRATLAGGTDPHTGMTAAGWRDRLAGRFAAELAAKPAYEQFRIIGVADGGRELLRVDRTGAERAIRIVPSSELQRKGDRGYFASMLRLKDTETEVSPIELSQESGAIETPHRPVFRVGTPVHGPAGEKFGIIVINVGLNEIFDRLRATAPAYARRYVINERGDYLLHPDVDKVFAFEFGRTERLQQDLSKLGDLVAARKSDTLIATDARDQRVAVAVAWNRLAQGPAFAVVDVIPYAVATRTALAVRDAVGGAAAIATIAALVLALFVARSVSRPLREMSRAVEAFGHGEVKPLPVSAGGEVGMLARSFDRMAAEVTEKTESLRRNVELLDKTVSSLGDALLVVDAGGRTILANPACKALFGDFAYYASGDWQRLHRRFRADGTTPMPAEEAPIGRVLRGESFDNLEVVMQRVGETRLHHIVATGRPMRDSAGRPEGAVIIYRDVTRLRDTERQLHRAQKMDAIGQLTGGVAHDFNNLLTVILGTADLGAMQAGGNPELHDSFATITRAAGRGATLTRQLLAFSRKQPLQPRETDINALIGETVSMLRPTLGEAIEIAMSTEPGLPSAVVDPSQLSTALINLAVNARDAMPGGGKLTVEAGRATLDEGYAAEHPGVAAGDYVAITITDTGCGIPPALRDKVFEPFFTTKETGKGTGLGLSMVYGFITQSGGHVRLYSEENSGTSVKLYLPCAIGTAAHRDPPEASAMVGGSETILVVEDDPLVRESVRRRIESLGYRTVEAANAMEALDLVRRGIVFDLLFSDVVMPGPMNGRDLADAVAILRPGLKVLYTSGYSDNALIRQGRLEAGIQLLDKPYRLSELAAKLRSVLDG